MRNEKNNVPTADTKNTRRLFLGLSAAAAITALFRLKAHSETAAGTSPTPASVHIVQFTSSGQKQALVLLPTVVKSDAEWKKQLTPEAYQVTRLAGTERPYSGAYNDFHSKGIFTCVCCGTALFHADNKFESGTGWPSFWQPIAKENVHETTDDSLGMARTAVSCRRCEAHLGHVFDDGPRPTGLRYCMNAVALNFTKAA